MLALLGNLLQEKMGEKTKNPNKETRKCAHVTPLLMRVKYKTHVNHRDVSDAIKITLGCSIVQHPKHYLLSWKDLL